jgi:hypothetical protein
LLRAVLFYAAIFALIRFSAPLLVPHRYLVGTIVILLGICWSWLRIRLGLNGMDEIADAQGDWSDIIDG